MKALITGASSGIGYDMAKYLHTKNCEIYAVGRNKERLENLQNEINCRIYICDLSKKDEVFKLYEDVKNENIDILINNAGFGLFGDFSQTPLEEELELIDTNITALHILTKLFYKDFENRKTGYILNVASSAAFMAGPLLSSYYASKNYVLQLTKAIYEENRRKHNDVHLSVLCPGPVNTRFNERANVKFALSGVSSEYVAKYAIDKMFKHKLIIIPTFIMKSGVFFLRFVSHKLAVKIAYHVQKKKQ